MFDDEYLVVVQVLDEKGEMSEAVAFVHKDELTLLHSLEKSKDVEALLKVSPMDITAERALIVLPQSTLANGPVVSVRKSDLVAQGG
jgi:hypothetical protein